jgi:hypothetical protein
MPCACMYSTAAKAAAKGPHSSKKDGLKKRHGFMSALALSCPCHEPAGRSNRRMSRVTVWQSRMISRTRHTAATANAPLAPCRATPWAAEAGVENALWVSKSRGGTGKVARPKIPQRCSDRDRGCRTRHQQPTPRQKGPGARVCQASEAPSGTNAVILERLARDGWRQLRAVTQVRADQHEEQRGKHGAPFHLA